MSECKAALQCRSKTSLKGMSNASLFLFGFHSNIKRNGKLLDPLVSVSTLIHYSFFQQEIIIKKKKIVGMRIKMVNLIIFFHFAILTFNDITL